MPVARHAADAIQDPGRVSLLGELREVLRRIPGGFVAIGRPLNKPGYSRHLIEADGSVRSLAYSQLDNRSLYRPGRITLRFVRLKVTEVEISGRNLYQLYDYIHSHRMPWVKIAARDFAADGEPVVTQIVIRDEPEKLGVK